MREAPFINRPMSVWLDLIRGLAALAVVIGHAVQLRIYTGPFPFTIMFQKNAVVVFFVLSGMVIAASVDRDRKTLSSFALARISRIVPVALGAIAFSLTVAALDVALPGVPVHIEDLKWADGGETLLAILFLSESHTSGYPPNAPYWSLCYEVWFYVLFAAATYLTGANRAVWLLLLAAVAGPNILLLLPVWLLGVVLIRLPLARRVPLGLALAFLLLGFAALFAIPGWAMSGFGLLRQVAPWSLGHSLYAVTDLVLALAIAAALAGLRTLSGQGWVLPERAEPMIRWGANMSFSLYLLHWPLLKLVNMTGLAAGTDPLAFVAIISGVIAISGAFATITEHKRFVIRDWVERMLRRPRLASTT